MSGPPTGDEEQSVLDELMAEMAKNEQDPDQCNEKTGRFNREFLYNVRDLEQLCSLTECPLEPHLLKKFGICRSLSIAKIAPPTCEPRTGPPKLRTKRVGPVEKQRAKVDQFEQDLEQCNEETGWYNREFLYTLRDLQKLYTNIEKLPLKDELQELGIWSSSQARGKCMPNIHTKPTGRPAKSRQMPEEALKPIAYCLKYL